MLDFVSNKLRDATSASILEAGKTTKRDETSLPEWYSTRAPNSRPPEEPTSFAFLANSVPTFRATATVTTPVGFSSLTECSDDEDDDSEYEVKEDDEVERAREVRFELLARKYVAHTLSQEELARLKIVTERLRALAPHVTPEQVAKLEKMRADLDSTAFDLAHVRAKYGLDK